MKKKIAMIKVNLNQGGTRWQAKKNQNLRSNTMSYEDYQNDVKKIVRIPVHKQLPFWLILIGFLLAVLGYFL